LKWWPDTLFGRLWLAVSAPIVLALGISLVLLYLDRQALARRLNSTDSTVDRIAELVPKLAGLGDAERRNAIEALDPRPREWRGRDMPPPNLDPPDAAERISREVFAEPLRQRLGMGYQVTTAAARRDPLEPLMDWGLPTPPDSNLGEPRPERPRPAFGDAPQQRGLYDIDIVAPNGLEFHFRVRGPPQASGWNVRLVWQLALLAAALSSILYITTRYLTRPLTNLQRAAELVGRSASRQPLREEGAREIRDTVRAFNVMQDRLHRYLDGRARVLASMSHDLRTPLTRMRLRAESIENATVRDKIAADIEEMDAIVSGALNLFRGLDHDEATSEVDLDALIATLASEFRELGGAVSVTGSVGTSIRVQPIGLKRAIGNLIDNAIKYGGRADIQIVGDPVVSIRVQDEGPGIPESQLEAVLQPFNRLEASRNRNFGGVGLGLCSAKDLIERQGGTLVLRNRQDRPGLIAEVALPGSETR
jgi:signal transduction histidine kinase